MIQTATFRLASLRPTGLSSPLGTELRRIEEGLIGGLERALEALQAAGCTRIYVDGSFVTAKESPGDYDVAWEPADVDVPGLLASEPVFGDFSHGCALQKAKYGGEFFPSSFEETLTGFTFLELFQTDRDTGERKGIVALDL